MLQKRIRFWPLFALLLAMMPSDVGAQARKSLDVIEMQYHNGPGGPMPINWVDDHYVYLIDAVSVTGRRWHGILKTSSPRNGGASFYRLQEGEILPLFGALYQVKLGKLIRMKKEDWPKGVSLAPDSFVVPVMRDDTGSGQITYVVKPGKVQRKTVFAPEIRPPSEKTKEAVAYIRLEDNRNPRRGVRVNEVIGLGESRWIVRSIVPPDRGRRIYGWVELARRNE